MLSVRFDPENGGIAALTFPDDPAALNWLHGEGHTFGTINGAEVLSVAETPTGMTAIYRTKHLLVRVERCLAGDSLRERYTFENALPADVFIGRGDVGIFTTFHDGYTAAGVCMRQRCHAHIWCGGESSYICARKMGPYPDGLGLVLTEGDLDTYSVLGAKDNTRGDFLLHPAPLCLCPGESFTVAWEIFRFREGTFLTVCRPSRIRSSWKRTITPCSPMNRSSLPSVGPMPALRGKGRRSRPHRQTAERT